MSARDELLASLVAERFTYLPENPAENTKIRRDATDWLLGNERLRHAELDAEMHSAFAAMGLAS